VLKTKESYITGIELEVTTTYSMELQKGWSVWYYSKSTIRTGNKIIITEQHSTIPVCDLKWYGKERIFGNFQFINH